MWFLNDIEEKKPCGSGSPDLLCRFHMNHTVLYFPLLRVEQNYRIFSNKRPGREFSFSSY